MPGLTKSLVMAYSFSSCFLVPAPVEFVGLLWSRLLAQTCFHRCLWSVAAPREVSVLVVLQTSLAQVYSLRSQTRAWIHRSLWFLLTPLKVPDLCPDLQRSL